MIGTVPVAVRGFEWEVDLTYGSWEFSIDFAKRLARLVLRLLDGSIDRAATKSDLAAWDIAEDGSVIPAPADSDRRPRSSWRAMALEFCRPQRERVGTDPAPPAAVGAPIPFAMASDESAPDSERPTDQMQ